MTRILNDYFKSGSSSPQKNLAILFSSALSGLRKEASISHSTLRLYLTSRDTQVKTPVADLDELLNKLLVWGLSHAENDPQREAVWQSISCLLNKRIDGERHLKFMFVANKL